MKASEMSPPYMDKVFATVVKNYTQQFSISRENLLTMSHFDLKRHFEDVCFSICFKMQGMFEETYKHSEETLPASLKDWIKFYVRKIPWGWLQRHISVNTKSLITHHYTRHHMCLHIKVDREFPHVSFMAFGLSFEKLNADAERAANEIIQAALVELDNPRNMPSSQLAYAIMRYKKAIGI